WAIFLGRFCMIKKSALVDAGNFGFGIEFDRGDRESFANLLQTDTRVGADSCRLETGLRQPGGKGHRKASGMRRADQLFRIRTRPFFKPRREGILTFKSAAAQLHFSLAVFGCTFP